MLSNARLKPTTSSTRTFFVGLLCLLAGCGDAPAPLRPSLPATKTEEPAPPPKRSDALLDITFEDLDLPMEPDSSFQGWMLTQRVRELEGRRVRITGFMSAAIFQLKGIRSFPLMREKECPYGPGGQGHHVIQVDIVDGTSLSFSTSPFTLEGVLTVRPFNGPNGKTWSVYHLAAGKAAK